MLIPCEVDDAGQMIMLEERGDTIYHLEDDQIAIASLKHGDDQWKLSIGMAKVV